MPESLYDLLSKKNQVIVWVIGMYFQDHLSAWYLILNNDREYVSVFNIKIVLECSRQTSLSFIWEKLMFPFLLITLFLLK